MVRRQVMRNLVKFGSVLYLCAVVVTSTGIAATFNLSDGDVTGLINAINSANANNQDDTINLTTGGSYALTAVDNTTDGATGLPIIRTDGGHTLTISSNKTTIMRSAGAPDFRVFLIGGSAVVTMNGLIVSNESSQQSQILATGLAPPNDAEAAILVTLSPGNYTTILSGVNNSTGNALAEVYGLN